MEIWWIPPQGSVMDDGANGPLWTGLFPECKNEKRGQDRARQLSHHPKAGLQPQRTGPVSPQNHSRQESIDYFIGCFIKSPSTHILHPHQEGRGSHYLFLYPQDKPLPTNICIPATKMELQRVYIKIWYFSCSCYSTNNWRWLPIRESKKGENHSTKGWNVCYL